MGQDVWNPVIQSFVKRAHMDKGNSKAEGTKMISKLICS